MTTNAIWIKVDPDRVVHTLQHEAVEKVNGEQGVSELAPAGNAEVVLDFSSVVRIDAGAVRAMEELVALAVDRSVKLVLSGVNMDIYKVLKLLKLAERFSFVN